MAYSELIKNFSKIREYMREFYVFGFRRRGEYTKKSARSYDDEKRRISSWLGDWMEFRQTAEGKNVFLSIDTRVTGHNPLYKAWKTKSFTDLDITLHFLILDILSRPGKAHTLTEIADMVEEQMSWNRSERSVDESTIRKKLKEYADEGLVTMVKKGRTVLYSRTPDTGVLDEDSLNFFSETAPCGVIGSFLLDRQNCSNARFAFKHHYITGALDSEILCLLLEAIGEKRYITIETVSRRKETVRDEMVVPLQILVSSQNGRNYLAGYAPRFRRITTFRLDNILSVRKGEVSDAFDAFRRDLEGMRGHMWGVSTQSADRTRMEHVEFTVRYAPDEGYIHARLEREKRCGTVEKISPEESRFSRDVYDAEEMIPWIRTFICRITDIRFSNPKLQESFVRDLDRMYSMYPEGGGEDAVQ